MVTTVKEYLKLTFDENNPYQVREPIHCADGYHISVQGGTAFHYCLPRRHVNKYECVECGFPTALDEELAEYAETPDTTDTVFGYVPIEVIEQVVAKHGGIVII